MLSNKKRSLSSIFCEQVLRGQEVLFASIGTPDIPARQMPVSPLCVPSGAEDPGTGLDI